MSTSDPTDTAPRPDHADPPALAAPRVIAPDDLAVAFTRLRASGPARRSLAIADADRYSGVTVGGILALVPYDEEQTLGRDTAEGLVAAATVLPEVLDVLLGVAGAHRPVYRFGIRGADAATEDVCPDCLGGLLLDPGANPDEPRECGCWGLVPVVCASCAALHPARLVPAPWPCATWRLLERVARLGEVKADA